MNSLGSCSLGSMKCGLTVAAVGCSEDRARTPSFPHTYTHLRLPPPPKKKHTLAGDARRRGIGAEDGSRLRRRHAQVGFHPRRHEPCQGNTPSPPLCRVLACVTSGIPSAPVPLCFRANAWFETCLCNLVRLRACLFETCLCNFRDARCFIHHLCSTRAPR